MPATVLVRGQMVGTYVVLERLGSGGMGVVYKAYDPVLGREVAIKLLRPDRGLATGPSTSLLGEAKKHARLSHPNVVTVYGVGDFLGQVFIAMEYVNGGTLGDWLKSGPPWREVLGCFIHAGEGLAAAHEQALVHRDFKPDNVLLDAGRVPRVTDFGLAREGEVPAAVPSGGSIAGTVGFLAPEQARGGVVNGRSDQFSFCAALHLGLYGELPFVKQTDLTKPLPPVPPAPAGSKVPAWLRRVVLKGLSEKPAERFNSMRSLLDALRADPARARQDFLTRAAGVLLVGALVTLAYFFSHRETSEQRTQRECVERADGELGKLWSPERQAAIQKAFGSGEGADIWGRAVRDRLSPEIGEWSKSSHAACAVQADPEERTRWLGCLEDRRKTLQGLSDLFEQPDPTVVEGALNTIIIEVSPASLCHLVRPGRSQAPHLASDVDEAIRSGLARARVRRTAGKYVDGIEEAKTVVELARKKGARMVEAEALLLEGELYSEQHSLEDATETLREATLAAEVVGDDEVRAQAWIALVRVYAESRQTRVQAREADAQASAILERLDNPPMLVAARYNAKGTLETKLDPQNVRAGESDFEHSLAELRRAGLKEDHPLLLKSKTNLGNSSPSDAGVALLGEVLRDRALIFGPDHPETARARVNLGVKLTEASELQAAIDQFEAALKIRGKFPDAEQDLANTHAAMADALEQAGELEASETHLARAVELFEQAAAPDEVQGRELNNLLELKKRLHRPAAELNPLRGRLLELGVAESTPDTAVPAVSPKRPAASH